MLSLADILGRVFGRPRAAPQPPPLPLGYSASYKQLPPALPGVPPPLPPGYNGALNQFIYYGEVIPVASSNVTSIRFEWLTATLTVVYHGGGKISAYQYFSVKPAEALSFFSAGSKGVWCWDNLRVRGSKTDHKKPFVKLY